MNLIIPSYDNHILANVLVVGFAFVRSANLKWVSDEHDFSGLGLLYSHTQGRIQASGHGGDYGKISRSVTLVGPNSSRVN